MDSNPLRFIIFNYVHDGVNFLPVRLTDMVQVSLLEKVGIVLPEVEPARDYLLALRAFIRLFLVAFALEAVAF